MKIAIMHYHLKPGGVTTVISQQVRALAQGDDVLVLSGETAPGFDCSVAVIPGIAYEGRRRVETPERTAADIVNRMQEHFGSLCDVLHVHNPTLRKNDSLLKVLRILQQRGVKLFLHIHDFAEDGRAYSYYTGEEYLSDCHYGVINSRDYSVLCDSGLKPEGLHRLFNVVTPIEGVPALPVRNRVVYPVRAIRRKNIGEVILLSLFLPKDMTIAITLPPTSQKDMPLYENWKSFSRRLNLPVEFEVGTKESFVHVMATARMVLTTSLKEGFGFSFLEPWTAGRAVIGRRLDAVCPDFEDQGITLPGLYSVLSIPSGLIDTPRFYRDWARTVRTHASGFGEKLSEGLLQSGFHNLSSGTGIDFGALNEEWQQAIITQASGDDETRTSILGANPFLRALFQPVSDKLISENARIIREKYSLDRYRTNLREIYRKVMEIHVQHAIDKQSLLDSFLSVDHFRMIASEPELPQ